jgi:hypothetical protein
LDISGKTKAIRPAAPRAQAQHDEQRDECPAGIAGPELSRQYRSLSSGGQRRQRHRPAALALPGRWVQVRAG